MTLSRGKDMRSVLFLQGQTYRVPIRLWRLAAAKVAKCPGGISEHAKLTAVTKESQQRLEGAAAQNVVTALWAVTSNVSESPDGLLPHIGFWTGEELDENGDGTGLDDDLGLCSASRGNVGQGPSSLELHKSMRRSEELDESGDNAGLDDLFDRGVALFGQKLPKTGGSLNLQIDLVGEDALYHLRKILAQLPTVSTFDPSRADGSSAGSRSMGHGVWVMGWTQMREGGQLCVDDARIREVLVLTVGRA